MSKIKIALVDDHQIVLDGLHLLLSSENDFEIVLQETSGFDLLEKLKAVSVDIVLTDLMMPIISGTELTLMLKKTFPSIKVIALSMNGDGASIYNLVHKCKVDGYLLKTSDKYELVNAIKSVVKNQTYFNAEIFEELRKFERLIKENEGLNLTSRELEIVKCIAKGMNNKVISSTLFISERTVETHRKNIYRKTSTNNAINLVEFANKFKLL